MSIKKVLFFLAGTIATGGEVTAMNKILAAGPSYDLKVRNTAIDNSYGAGPEAADYVAGTVPTNYQATPPAARWRILLHTANGGANAIIGDLEWHYVPGGPNVSGDATTRAASTGDVPSLYDGNHPQYWQSTTTIEGTTISLVFASPVHINEVLMWGGSQTGLKTGFPHNFDVQYSTDGGTTWVTAWNVANGTIATDSGSQVFTNPSYDASGKSIFVPVLDVDNIPTQNLLATQTVVKSGQTKTGVTGSGTTATMTVASGALSAIALS